MATCPVRRARFSFLSSHMFSQASTPPRASRTPRRAGSRASRAASVALQSGETTPRRLSPPASSLAPAPAPVGAIAPASTNLNAARLGAGLNLAAGTRALSAGPSSRRAKSSVASRSDLGSVIDLDDNAAKRKDKDDLLLVKDDHYIVTESRRLPTELHQVITTADPYTDPLQASLDSQTGFAFVVSREHCFVWNWSKRSAYATTYIFPLPASTLPAGIATVTPLCFASFVPSSATASAQQQREPGLLVISPTGLIRFWDSISMALSGVERFKAFTAPLNEGELVRGLKMLSPTSYLASTSHSRVLLISASSVGGRANVAVRALDRSVGWAGSMWTAVFGGQKADPSAGIRALAVAESNAAGDGRTLAYAVTDKSVQVWDLPWLGDGGERLAVEQDIFASVLESISGEKVTNEDWALNKAQVEIIDAAIVPTSGALALLASHVTDRTAPNALSYSIIVLQIGRSTESVQIMSHKQLHYQSPPDPRPLSSPKLILADENTAFVAFVNSVVMLSLDSDVPSEEAFYLRVSSHRFLGTSTPVHKRGTNAPLALSLLTSSATTIHVVASEQVAPGREVLGTEAYKTRRLKKKIEQAVYFGAGNEENALAFDLPADYEGDLVVAAEAVSAEILASASEHLPVILDLRAQLTDRAHRAKALIEYIGANGLLGRLSQTCRRRLSWNAERLAAGLALWRHRNTNAHAGSDLLADAIYSLVDTRVDQDLDPMRAFFRAHLSSLGKVLETLSQQARSLVSDSRSSLESRSAVMHEVNQLYLLVYNTIALHRRDTAKLYGLDSEHIPVEAWSSRPPLLEALPWHFETTENLLKERVRELGVKLHDESIADVVDVNDARSLQGELRKQMEGLAEYVFSMYEERLNFQQSDDAISATDNRQLNSRYLAVRARYLKTLVTIGKVPTAYKLAERHRDFRALVELCTDEQHGSPARVRYFMGKYSQDFAFSLYQYYLERGEHQTLLQQDEEYRPLLTSFLDSVGSPEIAWVNDLAIGRYQNVTGALVGEAVKEKSLAQKKLMLSIGKLAQIAQATSATLDKQEVQRGIEVVNDIIDLVNTQESLAAGFLSLLSGQESRLPVDEQAQVIAARVAPTLRDTPALAHLYSDITARLLAGITLSAEDLVDLLSLKGNVGEQAGDYAAALEILARAQDLPEARRTVALQNVWRRVYLRDDWASLRAANGLTDDELCATLRGTALYSTLAAAAQADLSPELYLEPGQSLFFGVDEEVAARFPGSGAMAVEGLVAAYEDENRQLQEALQQHDLDTYAKEIVRLLQATGPEHQSEGDQIMNE